VSNGLIVPILVIAVTGLMGLYAALRPEQYTRYIMAKWQRERIFGRFDTLRWVGWIVFGGCVVMFLFVVLQSVRAAILAYRGGLEAVTLLLFAGAWLWWGLSLLLRPDAFIRRTNARVSIRVVKVFGAVLLLGAVHFSYQLIAKVRSLLR
jgi:intracellular septation protein A